MFVLYDRKTKSEEYNSVSTSSVLDLVHTPSINPYIVLFNTAATLNAIKLRTILRIKCKLDI